MKRPISEVFFAHEAHGYRFEVRLTATPADGYNAGDAARAENAVGLGIQLAPALAGGLLGGLKKVFPAEGATQQGKEAQQ